MGTTFFRGKLLKLSFNDYTEELWESEFFGEETDC